MKILILGHGRHGKDTVADIMQYYGDYRFTSSSMFCCKKFIFDKMRPKYDSVDKCYEDRHNHREMWKWLICEYTSQDKSKLAREILEENDIYVGMRCNLEFEASKKLFDKILYVDAYPRVLTEDPTMSIVFDEECMTLIDNSDEAVDIGDGLEYPHLTRQLDIIFN